MYFSLLPRSSGSIPIYGWCLPLSSRRTRSTDISAQQAHAGALQVHSAGRRPNGSSLHAGPGKLYTHLGYRYAGSTGDIGAGGIRPVQAAVQGEEHDLQLHNLPDDLPRLHVRCAAVRAHKESGFDRHKDGRRLAFARFSLGRLHVHPVLPGRSRRVSGGGEDGRGQRSLDNRQGAGSPHTVPPPR